MTLKGCTGWPWPSAVCEEGSSLSDTLVLLSCTLPHSRPILSLQPSEIPLLASVREDMVVGPGCVMSLRNTCILREELMKALLTHR